MSAYLYTVKVLPSPLPLPEQGRLQALNSWYLSVTSQKLNGIQSGYSYIRLIIMSRLTQPMEVWTVFIHMRNMKDMIQSVVDEWLARQVAD